MKKILKKIEEKDVLIIAGIVFLFTVFLFFLFNFKERSFNFPGSGILDFGCGSVLVDSRDDSEYETVRIGDQCWFAENLKLGDVDSLSRKESSSGWREAGESNLPAYSVYNNDEEKKEDYGYLYNIHAVRMTGLCPDGWRIPDDEDWHILESYLADEDQRCRPGRVGNLGCSFAGAKLKVADDRATDSWNSPELNCDGGDLSCSGFNGLPAGARYDSGTFYGFGSGAFFWAKAEEEMTYRNLRETSGGVLRQKTEKGLGFSVRCIKEGS